MDILPGLSLCWLRPCRVATDPAMGTPDWTPTGGSALRWPPCMRQWSSVTGYEVCELASRDTNIGIPGCPIAIEFSSRMGYRPGAALYRYALEPTAGVCQLTLRYTNISTDVRCMPIGTATLTSGSELYPNANLDLARVSMDILLLWRYPESDPNDKNAYDAHL